VYLEAVPRVLARLHRQRLPADRRLLLLPLPTTAGLVLPLPSGLESLPVQRVGRRRRIQVGVREEAIYMLPFVIITFKLRCSDDKMTIVEGRVGLRGSRQEADVGVGAPARTVDTSAPACTSRVGSREP